MRLSARSRTPCGSTPPRLLVEADGPPHRVGGRDASEPSAVGADECRDRKVPVAQLRALTCRRCGCTLPGAVKRRPETGRRLNHPKAGDVLPVWQCDCRLTTDCPPPPVDADLASIQPAAAVALAGFLIMASHRFRRWLFAANVLIVGIAVVLGYLAESPARYFRKSSYTTWVSGAQLLAVGLLAWKIWRRRGGWLFPDGWKEPSFLWFLIAIGFFFLSVDELVQVHESVDRSIHDLLGLTETAVTDRLADVLVAGYGLIGLAVLFVYRHEFRLLRPDFVLIIAGFILMSLMVVLDILSSDTEFSPCFFRRRRPGRSLGGQPRPRMRSNCSRKPRSWRHSIRHIVEWLAIRAETPGAASLGDLDDMPQPLPVSSRSLLCGARARSILPPCWRM